MTAVPTRRHTSSSGPIMNRTKLYDYIPQWSDDSAVENYCIPNYSASALHSSPCFLKFGSKDSFQKL